jgi:Na+-transporting methylmalonyl-CoA/oxaloacetate decarboxylase gamma subunit
VSAISRSLLITLIGMGLVFIGILLLWGMMILLVRIFKDREEKEEEASPADPPILAGDIKIKVAAVAVSTALAQQNIQQAAAVAVATALAARQGKDISLELPYETMSSWLVAHRLEQINLRNHVFNRKSRGEQL